MLPKLTVSRPPMAGPTRSASWSVARRTHSASTAMASALEANTRSGEAPTRYFSAAEIGMRTRRTVKTMTGIRNPMEGFVWW